MKKDCLLFFSLCILVNSATAQVVPSANAKLLTPWASKVDIAKPLPEYPRPQMIRENNWVNLNGPWQYAILPKEQTSTPVSFAGNIVVPFAVESALSGVNKTVGKDSVLWYKRMVNVSNNKD